MRWLSPWSSLGLPALLGLGCSLFTQAGPPAREGEGEGEGEGEAGTLVVVAIDGDGSDTVLSPVGGVDLDIDIDGVAAAHRLVRRVRVEFEGASALDEATMVVDQHEHSLSIENLEDGVSFLTLPDTVPVRTLLPLTLLAGALTAHAEVFLLQGEPGPAGAPGLVTDRVATDTECPFGGHTMVFGTDTNGDGDLVGVEVASTRVDCDAVVRGAHAVPVANEDELRRAFAALDALRLSPSALVALDLPEGTTAMSGALTVTHQDGERILLRGAETTGSTLAFPDNSFGIVVDGGLRLQRVSISSPGPGHAGVGLLTQSAGFVVVEPSIPPVTVSGFANGVMASLGGVMDGAQNSIIAEDNDLGFFASRGGSINAPGAIARNNSGVGFQSDAGTLVVQFSSSSDNGRQGYLAELGGVLDASGARATEPVAAFVATHNAHLLCGSATATAPLTAAAFEGAEVVCNNATLNGRALVSTSAHGNFTNSIGTGLSIEANTLSTASHVCADIASLAACEAITCKADVNSQCLVNAVSGGGTGGGN